jgi:methyl-accepting chemotaxis protein
LTGNREIEDSLERLDKLTQEETRMASAEQLKMTYSVDDRVRGVGSQVQDVRGDVQGVGNKVQDVEDRVQGIDSNVRGIDGKLDQVNRSSSL